MAPLFLVGKCTTAEAPPSKTYTLLTSAHNDADNANDYNGVIGIAQLKAFPCANKDSSTDQIDSENTNAVIEQKKWSKSDNRYVYKTGG